MATSGSAPAKRSQSLSLPVDPPLQKMRRASTGGANKWTREVSMTVHARRNSSPDQSTWQTLEAHATSVAFIAASFASVFGAAEWGKAAGLLHDLGKRRKPFQDMLKGLRAKDKDTQHAKYGAALAFANESLPLAFATAGHHAGLHDLHALQTLVEGIESLPLPARFAFPPLDSITGVRNENVLSLEFFTRLLFSCLIDADRLDAAFWEAMGARTVELATPMIPLEADVLLERTIAERASKRETSKSSPMSSIRNRIFDACVSAGEHDRGFFSLTVPTGGGKTLAGMAFALAHAKRHKVRRVIVVIPYLSIIEQNAAEYRRFLDPEKKGIVLECHSSVKPNSKATDEEIARLELITENWDAPVIVTTSVQFIESLFAASPSRARKLHNIANSVVLFDEVQTLPTALLTPTLSVFRELAANYGVSFVFSTATQPAFRRSSNLTDGFAPNEIREIVPEPDAIFKALQRVNYVFEKESIGWEQLADILATTHQCLCVVNLTRHAYELWHKLNEKTGQRSPKPFHLSAAMCPAHRLAVIRSIRRALKAGRPCRVISTQLIEAGVDVDFPVVWRAMGPLDSIVQVAGRCNREGSPIKGTVHVFTPVDNKLPGGIYSTATDQAAVTLAKLRNSATGNTSDVAVSEALATDPGIFTSYFSSLFQLANTDGAEIQKDRAEFHYRTVSEKAVVIKDSGTPVIIPFGRARHLVQKIRERVPTADGVRFTRNDLRALQRYMVNMRQNDFLFLKNRKLLDELLPNLEIYILNIAQYNSRLGVLKPDQFPPMEDFIQ